MAEIVTATDEAVRAVRPRLVGGVLAMVASAVPVVVLALLVRNASGPVAPSPDCTIKGNVNTSGECIYHTPASRWYARIQMHVSKGTRWFCSAEDAEAAGCRETKR